MTKQKKSRFIFIKASWWSTILAGIAIGIISQRIPEIKFYTDEIVKPIEKSNFFKELKSKLGNYYHEDSNHIALGSESFPYSHYPQENPFPGQPVIIYHSSIWLFLSL